MGQLPIQSKKTPISILLFLSGGIVAISGWSSIDMSNYERQGGMLVLIALGLVLIIASIWLLEKGVPIWLNSFLDWAARHQIDEWHLSCLLLSLPVVSMVPLLAGTEQKMVNPLGALFAWFLAIGLVVVGAWIQETRLRWPSWRVVLQVLIITGIAFIVRAILINHIPLTLTGDEAAAGISAEDFTHGSVNNIFITTWYAFPSFYFSIPSIFIRFFGHTIEALRIPSAIAGALTVTATYFVARAIFGKRTALFAAIFLAALHFHINFSRIGLNNIWDGLWYIVTIGSLWYGWMMGKRNAYLLAGLSLGLSQYFYSSSRTIILVIIGWILIAAILDRARLKQAWLDLVILFFTAGVIDFPLICYYIKFPNTFIEPMNRVALTSAWLHAQVLSTGTPAWKIILNQAVLAIGSFTNVPLHAWYTPGVPLLRPIAASLFLIGIILLFFKGNKWHIIPIILWLVAFMIIGGFSESTPAAQRYVAAAPVCAIVVGLGISESGRLFERSFIKNKTWIAVFSMVLAILIAVDEIYFYFGVYIPSDAISEATSNGQIAQSLANELKTEPNDTEVLFFGFPGMGYYSIPSIQYLMPEIKGVDINGPWNTTAKPTLVADHLMFVFLPNNVDQIPMVQADYPSGKLTSVPAANGNLLYKMYKVTIP